MIVYRRHEQPGCGGCFLVAVLFLLLFGGTPLLAKVLGTIFFIGLFLVFSIVAAFWVFSYYIRKQVSAYEQSQTEAHNTFVLLLINILVKIAEIDGTVTNQEIQTIQNFFRAYLNYNQSQMLWVKELIKDARQSDYSIDDLLTDFRQRFAYEPRLILVELVYQVLFTKDTVPDQELELAQRIAIFLQISAYDLQSIKSKYIFRAQKAETADVRYYEILGLRPGASFEEIKTAYRKLSQKYHPDKVGHLGEEFRKVAEEKMKELNIAYQHLKKKFS